MVKNESIPHEGKLREFLSKELAKIGGAPTQGGSTGGQATVNAGGIIPFSAETASVTVSPSFMVGNDIVIGTCRLSCLTAPVGSVLTWALEKSTDGGTTWSTVQSLSISAGSTAPVSANPNATVTANSLLRVNSKSSGSTTAATKVLLQVNFS